MVYLVGAGPGDPRMLTLRGAECLGKADVVLHDYLASVDLLRHAPASAEKICLGRHGTGRLMSQAEINQLMVDYAQAGKTVVRLKGGDPGIFGRLAEESAALQQANLNYEIVPCVTTAVAAGAYAGVTLTDRDQASCVAFVTGREQAGKDDADALNYHSLAQFPGTLVFYMGVTTAPIWSRALIEHGKDAHTPVQVVRHCSRPTQQTWGCRLDEVAHLLAPGEIRPPVVVIVGEVAREQALGAWFTNRPLFGQTVLVTRPAHQADAMASQLLALGAAVLYQPAITIGPPADWGPVDRAIEQLNECNWIVFASRNGVEYFLERLRDLGHDLRSLAGLKIAAVGSATAEVLAQRGLQVDIRPAEFRAEALAAELKPIAKNQNFLLLRANRGREVLAGALFEAGGNVQQVTVYDSRDATEPDESIAAAMAAGEIDWVTATSSSTARSLVHLFGDSLAKTKLVAISPLTGGKLSELGYEPTAVAEEYTTEGVVAAILGDSNDAAADI